MMRPVTLLLLAVLPLLVRGTPVRADFYTYEDKNGTMVIVDDASKVPPAYRNRAKPSSGWPTKEVRTTPAWVQNNRVVVPVMLGFRERVVEAMMLVDTGASTTSISPALAHRLGIRREHTERSMSQVADGRYVESSSTHLDFLMVGPKQKNYLEVTIMPANGPDLGFDGLLGMNFLRDFRYNVDVNNRVIEWQ